MDMTIHVTRTAGGEGSSPPSPRTVEEMVKLAATSLGTHGTKCLTDFDRFPAPLYATDDTGTLVYFNRACVGFAGREPAVGVDKWCVSWKLSKDDGSPLPHDECPMATAVHTARPVRGVEAIAERPDGGRKRFRPFPTPALDKEGRLVGAINLLVPTDGETCRDLLATAQKCRRLAGWVDDSAASKTLVNMAVECEGQAELLRIS
jgi:PAS domain-containing protein